MKQKGFENPNTGELRQHLKRSGGPKQKWLSRGKPKVGIQAENLFRLNLKRGQKLQMKFKVKKR